MTLAKSSNMNAENIEMVIDGVPYRVRATPFTFNEETRFKVDYDGEEYIFTWDSSLGRLAPIGSESATLPDSLEVEVAQRLQSMV